MNWKNETVLDEIENSRMTLGINEEELRLLSDEEIRFLTLEMEAHFVASPSRYWWWEDFRLPASKVLFEDSLGYQRILQIVPDPDEKVWWRVEETQLHLFPIYEASPRIIQQIIGECYDFEYYLIAKDFSWLLCETHHSLIYAIGDTVEEKLQQIKNSLGNN